MTLCQSSRSKQNFMCEVGRGMEGRGVKGLRKSWHNSFAKISCLTWWYELCTYIYVHHLSYVVKVRHDNIYTLGTVKHKHHVGIIA